MVKPSEHGLGDDGLCDVDSDRRLPRDPLAETLIRFGNDGLPNETELDAMFYNSIRLAGRANLEAAMDGLIEILRQEKRYRGDRARLVLLSILELYDPADTTARQYRAELASVLF